MAFVNCLKMHSSHLRCLQELETKGSQNYLELKKLMALDSELNDNLERLQLEKR